jgi:hypothetical protein
VIPNFFDEVWRKDLAKFQEGVPPEVAICCIEPIRRAGARRRFRRIKDEFAKPTDQSRVGNAERADQAENPLDFGEGYQVFSIFRS